MSTILDQFGRGITRRPFSRAVNRDPFRGMLTPTHDKKIHEWINQSDRRALAALSRNLVFNLGPAKEAIRQKASFSVGNAWRPTYTGPDMEAGAVAADWLVNDFHLRVDLHCGPGAPWCSYLERVSKGIDRDGETFRLLTTHPDTGRPVVQCIPPHLVRSLESEETVVGGAYDGAELCEGIAYDSTGAVLFYRVYHGSFSEDFTDVLAASMVHDYDADFPDQRRGFPAFAHSLGDMLNSLESKELELLRQIIISNIFLIDKGGPPPMASDTGFTTTAPPGGEGVTSAEVAPGIRHLESGQALESITHSNPGTIWESFQDRLWLESIVGIGWSYGLVWKAPGQGTAMRAEIVRARQAVTNRQRTLRGHAIRIDSYALAAADAGGLSPAPPSPGAWSYSVPARLTVDDGREAKSMFEQVEKGAISFATYQEFIGQSVGEHFRQVVAVRREAETAIAEAAAEGLTLTLAELYPGPLPVNPEILIPDD